MSAILRWLGADHRLAFGRVVCCLGIVAGISIGAPVRTAFSVLGVIAFTAARLDQRLER
jgi:hypothetical protein